MQNQDHATRVDILNDDVEVSAIEALLHEEQIPYALRSYHDSALDGMFQTQQGWGELFVPEEHAAHVRRLLAELRDSLEQAPSDPPHVDDETE